MKYYLLNLVLLVLLACKLENNDEKKTDLKTISVKEPTKLEFNQGEYNIIVKSTEREEEHNYYMTIINKRTKASTFIELDYFDMNEGNFHEVLSFEDFNFDSIKELKIIDDNGGIEFPGFWLYDSETLKPKKLFIMDKNIDYYFVQDGENLDKKPSETIETNYFKGHYDFDKKTQTLKAVAIYGRSIQIIEEYKYDPKTRKYNIKYIETIE